MKITSIKLLAGLLLLGSMFVGCSRDTVMPELERPARTDTQEDRLKDQVYMDTYQIYLWQEDLPDWFSDVRGNTSRYNSADAVLEALKGYARDDEGNPYDRFSFLDRWGTVNAEVQQGLAGSFGLDVRYQDDERLYVKKVDIGSPAYAAGIRRGWQLLQINGNSDLSLAALERDNLDFLFNALSDTHISLSLRKPDGGEVSISLDRGNYQLQPISAHQLFTVGAKKVGYFAFDSFISTLNSRGNATYVKNQLDQLVAEFEDAGIQELIVDLRYNGGGAVVTAEYLSNLLAPTTVGNRLMYTNKINGGLEDFLQAEGVFLDFSPVHFNKVNALNLQRIYFLVTEGTASASELLINNLKPYMDVKLIGEHLTYGKPVGYFNWNISGVDLYAVSYQTFNALGEGDYFSGMPVDKLVYDDLTRDFGDVQEDMVAEALYHAANGHFSAEGVGLQSSGQTSSAKRTSVHINRVLDRHGTKGMYHFAP
ncbi:S41 family peptidase [Parapedobacter koreensis]|uniref:Peptidase family S41 n=1 Tax=Parapedobacter koreensis TaxID=332977 RepID=A0A1H7J7S2_9SPHI|nr:S41 family peptidase [Parapedobacter koreensis]SEK70779.1 Peptidase family S41 [Parapedobacter koreensis]